MLWYARFSHLLYLFNINYWLKLLTDVFVGYGHTRAQFMGCVEHFRADVSIPRQLSYPANLS